MLYDKMASVYHLIFEDWESTIIRQQSILSRLLAAPKEAGYVLDCACGIGTQALGLARAGFAVAGSDLSAAEIDRAKHEAISRNLEVDFRVDDMRELQTSPLSHFGVVLALDNALPHLDSDEEILTALSAMRDRLRPGGQLLVSLRDYGPLMAERPAMTAPQLFSDNGLRRIVHQVWDWRDERRYMVHIFITRQLPDLQWCTSHFTGLYRAITPQEVATHAARVGFQRVNVLSPSASGFYQPIVTGIRP